MRIQSRDIDDLRPDVAANLRIGIRLCAAKGLKVGVSATYRNQEYQTWLFEQDKAPRLVAFHGWRLAFDIFQNIPNREWEDSFFNKVAVVFKEIGFSWMYDIADYDKCHFQWDNHRKVTTSMLRSGVAVPDMPAYQEDNLMAQFIENMASKYGKTTTEIETMLETILKTQLHAPAQWEQDGERFLRTKGLTTSEHNPNELMTFGVYGALESRK